MAESDESNVTPEDETDPLEGLEAKSDGSKTVSLDTLEKLKSCTGFVEVDPRLLQAFSESVTMNNDVGYFLKDISCQTEESSITDLNDMIKIIQNLLKEITVVKRNLLFAKQLLHADYDAKVGGRAMDLYCSVNDRLSELEKLYEDRLITARRSYKTQMADACKKIAGEYKKYYTKLMELETGQSGSVVQELRESVARQAKQLKLQEQSLQGLRGQLLEAETRVSEERYWQEESEGSFKTATPPPPPQPDFLANTIDPDTHKKVVGERDELARKFNILEEELSNMSGKQKRVEARLKLVRTEGETERSALEAQIRELKEEAENLHAENERLEIKVNTVKKVAFVDSSASPTPPASPDVVAVVPQGDTVSNSEVEARIKEEVQKVRTEMMIKSKKENELIMAQSRDNLRVEQEKRAYAERLLQSQQDLATRDSGALAMRHLQVLDEEQRGEIARLNKELDRTTCIYEKKLQVLHSTMINLKNEVYMRNLLHRHAAQLHQATLSYASEAPAGGSAPRCHRKFPERHAPLKSIPRPPTVFTEDGSSVDKHISTFLTEQQAPTGSTDNLSENTLNISAIVK